MINTLHISRFKSIKELSLDCRRVNVFIGEPNTGKSNILEALGMFSFLGHSDFARGDTRQKAQHFVRFERTSNLFYDENLDRPLEIKCDNTSLSIEFTGNGFTGTCEENGSRIIELSGDHNAFYPNGRSLTPNIASFKSYRFTVHEVFTQRQSGFLVPPSGDNLLSLLLANRELMKVVNQPFLSRGLRLGLRPQEGKLEVVKQVEDVIISYPYSLASETLQRLTFYLAAILSNKDSVLIFEEPESHAFPYYTKQLAETIALDENQNQYFISTHNPYFLLPLLAKIPKDDLAVNIVYYEDYQTKVKTLTEQDLAELGEIDVFSNLERYLENK
jgi:AAA15 family ATPase/GTPase